MIKNKKNVTEKDTMVLFLSDSSTKSDIEKTVSEEVSALITKYKKAKRLKKESFEIVQTKPDPKAPNVVLVNLGEDSDLTVTKFRNLAGSVVRALKKELSIQWVSVDSIDNWELILAQVIEMVQYSVPNQKSAKDSEEKYPSHSFVSSKSAVINEGMVVGQAVNKARSFANQPANVLTTTEFVNQIKKLLKGDKRYKVTVLNESDLKKEKDACVTGCWPRLKIPVLFG